MVAICVPEPDDAAALGEIAGHARLTILVWDGSGPAPDGIGEVEFLVGPYMGGAFGPENLALMPRLRVIQLFSAGVEPWLPLVPDGVVLCNGRGVHGGSTAELGLAGLLALLHRLPDYLSDQHHARWDPQRGGPDLDDRRVLLLGAGDIAQRVATAVEVFGARTHFVARTEREGVSALAEVAGLLGDQDVVVVALPLTAATEGLVDAQFLAALPDGAVLVNVSRGRIVDTDALLAELTRGRLSAFLDVVEPEPLPADHPLWRAPNLLLTPHVGGGSSGWRRRAERLLQAQVTRFLADEPLANVVHDGY
jgi:phosphoglycerate dehydrogenase-like enzyme